MSETPLHILEKYWGYTAFREPQDQIVDAVLQGKDTLALLPTGGGKSICFQVPGMVMDGLTLVVSPLISLMKDQVQNLQKRGIPAVAIHTGMPSFIVDKEMGRCVNGEYKFLYVSPERLKSFLFTEPFRHMKVSLIAVDEAHCISQWGYDFRPVYLEIAQIRRYHPKVPCLALTATATPEVAKDICTRLGFPGKPHIIGKSFARDNLFYTVSPCERKDDKIMEWLQAIKGTAIVYTRNRKHTERFSEYLNANGITADFYHAGLDTETREAKQQRWMMNGFRVMVATNAFGMGIDKPDVRLVLHTDVPESPEAYFQEAGRGGRDGKPAFAVLPVTPKDKDILESRFAEEFPSREEILRVYKALCNHLQLPVGAGENEEFRFNPDKLAETYGLQVGHLFRCLKLLEREGYLYLNETAFEVSTLRMRMGNRALYDFMVRQPRFEAFVQTVIRSYGGLFEDYVRISEHKLAVRFKASINEVLDTLKKLDQLGVWEYRVASNLPSVTFTLPRFPEEDVTLDQRIYGTLKKTAGARYGAMIDYISQTQLCRSRVLLHYFGETATRDCGRCDVCRKRETVEKQESPLEYMRKRMAETDIRNFSDMKSLLQFFGLEADEINKQWITKLVDEGVLSFSPVEGYRFLG